MRDATSRRADYERVLKPYTHDVTVRDVLITQDVSKPKSIFPFDLKGFSYAEPILRVQQHDVARDVYDPPR